MIIGRQKELSLLEKALNSTQAEFITIYGRRRVGKTYLIREYFSAQDVYYFQANGVYKGTLKQQLHNFSHALSSTFFNNIPLKTPSSWSDAFDMLHNHIIGLKEENKKIVLFLDELPWMYTRKSSLLQVIDFFWNRYWSSMPKIIFIICGSSASWLIQKIIYNKGGLHNRTTLELKIHPFTLSETKQFFKKQNIFLSHQHILDIYMALGGIPYYLKYIKNGLSSQQNIQDIFFEPNAPLRQEYDKLFDSLFDNSLSYKELISLIATKRQGMTRGEVQKLTKLSTGGGRLSQRIKDLCDTGFLEEYIPWGKTLGEYYKVVDEFCIFYLKWCTIKRGLKFAPNHWFTMGQRPEYYSWSGYCFEAVVHKHIHCIISTLKISNAISYGSWRFIPKKKENDLGAQINLLIDRSDNAITICEIKHTQDPFIIDKEYAKKLENVIEIFKAKTAVTKQIFLVIISAQGVKTNENSQRLLSNVISLDDFFT